MADWGWGEGLDSQSVYIFHLNCSIAPKLCAHLEKANAPVNSHHTVLSGLALVQGQHEEVVAFRSQTENIKGLGQGYKAGSHPRQQEPEAVCLRSAERSRSSAGMLRCLHLLCPLLLSSAACTPAINCCKGAGRGIGHGHAPLQWSFGA